MLLIDIIYSLGLTLGVGSSTFALIFFIQALRDGVMDPSERSFLHSVIVVLRIGMILLGIALAGYLLLGVVGASISFALQAALLLIITVNAILMDRRIMPMRYGPIIAGGSWYSMFFVSHLPVFLVPLWVPILGYLVFLVVLYFVFHAIKDAFSKPAEAAAVPPSPKVQ